jgi:hypothetical protein
VLKDGVEARQRNEKKLKFKSRKLLGNIKVYFYVSQSS